MANEFAQETMPGQDGRMVWKVKGRVDLLRSKYFYTRGETILRDYPKIILDMTEMEYLSSSGVRALLRLMKFADKNGKEFVARGAKGEVFKVLMAAGLNELLGLQNIGHIQYQGGLLN